MKFKAEKYIEKAAKGEPELEEQEWEGVFGRLEKPFGITNYQHEGRAALGNTERGASFDYKRLDDSGKDKVSTYIEDKKFDLEEDEVHVFLNPDTWLEATNVVFKIGGVAVDFSMLLPPGARVFFCPTSDILTGAAVFQENSIYVLGDLSNLIGLITALHEMGHLRDDARVQALTDHPIEDGEYFNEAEKLRSERAASAFALSVLRPAFKDRELKKDTINFLKSYALQGYYSSVSDVVTLRESLKRAYAKDMDDADPYGDEYAIFDDWQKWRNTPAYQQWINMEENKDIDIFDQYGAWREWVQSTGYDYTKDF